MSAAADPAAPLPAPLPWQEQTWQRLGQVMAQDRLAHALLISGARGTGKRRFAGLLAAALLCRTPAAQGLPCGRCGDCRQVAAESHPGYFAVRPEEGKRDISIEAVRQLCERLVMTSHDGRAKVAVIDPADALNLNGVNALLKTIEEPPPRSHLLLISERPLALRATLRSRCQQLRLKIPPRAEARAWLAQCAPAGHTQADLDAALGIAHGAALQALELLKDDSLALRQSWRKLMLDLGGGRGDPLAAAAAVGEEQAGAFLRWLYTYLLELLQPHTGGTAPPSLDLGSYVDELVEHLRRLESNAKPQLVLEALFIRWVKASA